MSPFDYSAPAELFLSKPAKGSRKKVSTFCDSGRGPPLRVEDLRTP